MTRVWISLFGLVSLSSLASGCLKFASAAPVTSIWVSKAAGLVLVIQQRGSDFEGELKLLSDGLMNSPEKKLVQIDCSLGSMPFTRGLRSDDGARMLFPLKNVNLVQANSAKLLEKNDSPYVEIDLPINGEEMTARWRKGVRPPEQTKKFLRCHPIEE